MGKNKYDKHSIEATDAAGFRLQSNGELSTHNDGENTESFHVPVSGPSPTPESKIKTKDDIITEINNGSSHIKIQADKINLKVEDPFQRLVEETLNGLHGSGRERMISLGTDYAKVQQEVNRRLR